MATREELVQATKEKYLKVIESYLSRPQTYDIIKFAKLNGASTLNNVGKWLIFAKENLNQEQYAAFVSKAAPFEMLDEKEKQELKEKVGLVATKVFQRKANLIDIVKEITPSVEKYMYMVKQLKFTYGEIPAHVFNKNLEYCERISRYNTPNQPRNISIIGLSLKDQETIEKILSDNGLLDNDVTYHEAFLYAQRNNLISMKKSESRQ